MAKPFDLLALLAAFARERGIPLNAEDVVDQFVIDAVPRLRKALSDPGLLYGTRTENLFEALVLSLGKFRVFKLEDFGRVHAGVPMRAPDFRIVLDDGEQWLVEVKNVHSDDPMDQRKRLTPAYMKSLEEYATAVGTSLRLALYWSRWSVWTLINPTHFRTADGGVEVTMLEAFPANEMARLGDLSMHTVPPLRFELKVDREKPHQLHSDNMAEFVIAGASVFSGETELIDPKDRQLAMIMMMYGEWPIAGPLAVMDGEELLGVQYVAEPEEPSGEGFDGIGWASRIYTRYFAAHTLEGEKIIQLSGEAMPDWFAPLATWDFNESRLPLWLFRLQATVPRSVNEDSLAEF